MTLAVGTCIVDVCASRCVVTCRRDCCCKSKDDSSRVGYAIQSLSSDFGLAVRGWATRVTCAGDTDARTRVSSRIIHCGGRRCRAAAIPRSFSTRRTILFIVPHGNCCNLLRRYHCVMRHERNPRRLVNRMTCVGERQCIFVYHAATLTAPPRLFEGES